MDWHVCIAALHAAATVAMGGLIWFVQVVHYPLFAQVDASNFGAFAARHVRQTGRVVAPLMLLELACAGLLATWLVTPDSRWWSYVGLALLAVVWLSTAFLQVPCHRRLEASKDLAVIRRLVASNWLRTIAWSARSLVALRLLVVHAAA